MYMNSRHKGAAPNSLVVKCEQAFQIIHQPWVELMFFLTQSNI